MKLRPLGFGVQELEAGPFVFLLSQSIPVAYRDARPEAGLPGVYRTDAWFSKATTAHLNKWLGKREYATIPHRLIIRAFEGLSRYSESQTISGETS